MKEEHEINYYEYGLQNSRGFRALKVWLALRHAGRRGIERMIGDDIRLTQAMHDALRADPDCEALTRMLSIVTFRYRPQDLAGRVDAAAEYLDELNDRLLERLRRSGVIS